MDVRHSRKLVLILSLVVALSL
ncbi:MAG: hypothetical protein QG637_1547, partial [Chloroflexota bacterium]|nr:hypothetical protein [Chloroflexota bacterium]